MLNARQLRILQPVPRQQSLSLLSRQKHMFWHQLMLRDVHQQLTLHERLDAAHVRHAGNDFERTRGRGHVCDEDAGVVVCCARLLDEVAHMFHADGRVLDEGDVDCSDVCFGIWVGRRRDGGVFAVHLV